MTAYWIEDAADRRVDEIYLYTFEQWGEAQADVHIEALFTEIDAIARGAVAWRRIPAEYGIDGYFRRGRNHIIYWKGAVDGTIRVFSILHERMNQHDRLRDDLGVGH